MTDLSSPATAAPRTLQARIYEYADRDPDRRAIGFYDSERNCHWLSYEQLMERATRVADTLRSSGLEPGQVAVLVVYNDLFGVESLVGTLVAGGIPLLVAPPVIQGVNSSLGEILDDVIRRTDAAAVIGGKALGPEREGLEAAHPHARFFHGEEDLLSDHHGERHHPSEEDFAAFQLTSGTTGFPRICTWRQASVISALEGMAAAMDVGPDDLYLNWTPLYHDMGLINNIMLCLTQGIPLVMMSPFDFVKRPALWLQAMSDTSATVTWSPNFGYALAADRIRDDEMSGVDLGGVTGFWNAAERIHWDTVSAFEKRFTPFGLRPHTLKTNFGCAENVGGATFTPPGEDIPVERVDPVALHEAQEAVVVDGSGGITLVGCGKPHPGIRAHILGEDGSPLPDGHVGELALDTVSAMAGYLGDQEATAAAFDGDLLKTGDLGYLRDGELFWTGRARERITVRGRKIDPSDFESALSKIPELRTGSFAAFGVDDPENGTQRVVIVAETRDGTAEMSDQIRRTVRRAVFERLGLGVDEVLLVRKGTLTKTSSGKRRHRLFRDLYLEGGLRPFEVEE